MTNSTMIDETKIKSWERYNALLTKKNLAETVGRPAQYMGTAKHIISDIKNKLELGNDGYCLDIGCGYGEVTQLLLQYKQQTNISLTLLDTPEILKNIQTEFSDLIDTTTQFVEGYFPDNDTLLARRKYDYILVYSVIQATDFPVEFIEKAVELLAPGGKLLLGDIPNLNKKGRFLSNDTGRAFEASFQQCDITDVPIYADQFDFLDRVSNANQHMNDDLVINTIKKYRSLGFDVYVLPQPSCLPFSKTREDLLIVCPLQ